jgi:dihydroorotase
MDGLIIRGAILVDGRGGEPYVADVYVAGGKVARIVESNDVDVDEVWREAQVIDAAGLVAAPGLVDVHVHFRDPGFTEKEDVFSGAAAAAAGGFTTVCCMPNTEPAVDSPEVLMELDARGRAACMVNLLAVSAMTRGQKGRELTDLAAMASARTRCRELTGKGIAGVSEDGRTLDDENLMRRTMLEAKRLGLTVMDHAEPEEEITERDIRLARETGAHVHIQHVSTAAAVAAIRRAKRELPNISCETAPHYIALTSEALDRMGANAKMNPPLKTERDREAILEGLADGTIDIIATDHAPHTAADKAGAVDKAPFGVIGLETSFAVAFTLLVKTGVLTLPQLVEKMSVAPVRLIGLRRGIIDVGEVADIVLTDPNYNGVIDSSRFRSKARNTPFDGMDVSGAVTHTLLGGKLTFGG